MIYNASNIEKVYNKEMSVSIVKIMLADIGDFKEKNNRRYFDGYQAIWQNNTGFIRL